MHGIIGQFTTDPVRVVIGILAVIALVAIIHCLSGLAYFDSRSRPGGRQPGSAPNRGSRSIEE